jgi:hypothetical protein
MNTNKKDEAAAFLEKQLEKEAPNIDNETRRVLARLGASLANKEAAAPETKAKTGKTGELVQLPLWAEATRGTPNSFLERVE